MNASQYQAEIEDALSSHPLTGMPGAVQVGGVQGMVIEAVRKRLVSMVLEKIDTVEERVALVDGALAAFDNWDIPRIGGFVESMLKASIRPALSEFLSQLIGLAADKLAEA